VSLPADATGTVQFKNGSTIISTQPVAGGAASYTWSPATPGNKTITAVYSGDANLPAGVTNLLTHQVLTVMSTSAVLLSNKASYKYGESLGFTAAVDPPNMSSGESLATGATVTFMVNRGSGLEDIGPPVAIDGAPHATTTTIGGVNLTITITCTYPPLRCTIAIDFSATASDARFPVSNWSYRLEYSGNANYRSAASPSSKAAIVKAATTTSPVLFVTPTTSAAPHTYSVTISPVAPGTGVPTTGTVQFKMDGTNLGAPQPVSNGSASLTYGSPLPTGTHTIRAVFSGNGAFLSSSSPTGQHQLVNP
jgi:hypothetical protein